MPPHHTILLAVTFLVAFDALLIFVIVPMWIGSMWRPLADKFPPIQPAEDAIRRSFQSFSIGIINLGFSIHVAADAHHLHLYPTLLARRFRITPVSIPWEKIDIPPRGRARIGGYSVHMPRWCRRLAAREPASA